MDIILGKTAGFCFGVENAIKKAVEECKKNGETYCLGDLANNKQVTEDLRRQGIRIVNNINEIPEGTERLILRAHGVAREIYEEAENRNMKVIDLTCPKVLKIHKLAEEYTNKEYYIFLVGKKDHPENIGTISYCGDTSNIIEEIGDVEVSMMNFENSGKSRLAIICQTTMSFSMFEDIIEIIRNRINKDSELKIINTICEATRVRQEETKDIARQVDYMIVIGGKKSSNSTKLYEIAKQYCPNSVHVETKEELDIEDMKRANKVGIMAGASTPKKSIEEVVEFLKSM